MLTEQIKAAFQMYKKCLVLFVIDGPKIFMRFPKK